MHDDVGKQLPFEDTQDFEDARRGFIATLPEVTLKTPDGRVIWDLGPYRFLDRERPPATVNPSLWRLARLNLTNGLFQVADRIYQVRGFDASNMTIIEGETGLIILDPLISTETAKAALDLYRRHRAHKRVVAVIHTHSHVDHYGGVKGVTSEEEVKAGKVKVIAPDGFLEEAISENVFAGNAMNRRSLYMFGGYLPQGRRGSGRRRPGEDHLDGDDHPHPAHRPGAQDRRDEDRRRRRDRSSRWPRGPRRPPRCSSSSPSSRRSARPRLPSTPSTTSTPSAGPRCGTPRVVEVPQRGDRALRRSDRGRLRPAPVADVGAARVVTFLKKQRDLYKYIHDQTLRLLNSGYTMTEIAEMVALPRAWRGSGTIAATTAPSITTPRRSTSATSAGTTRTRRTCIRSRRRKPRRSTSSSWAVHRR